MDTMKYRLFSNLCIFGMLLTLFCIAYDGGIKSVFNPQEIEPYYCGDANKNNISLMINVYWGNEYIEPMLKTLKDNDVKTTFFVGGSWANKETELLQKIVADGHEIGNHGYNHKAHSKLTYEQNYNEINKCHEIILAHTGKVMTLFAPPSGDFNKTTLKVADALKYKTIMWSKDTIDWRDHNTDLIVKRATKNLKNGDLILMHPTENTLQALPQIIEFCKRNNFNITTVTNCLNLIA